MKTNAVILLLLCLMVSCNDHRLNFDRGIIPPVAVNFSKVNSQYDDYNSDLEITWASKTFSLIFSSSRKSSGDNFDFIGYRGKIFFDLITGEFRMETGGFTYSVLDGINSSGNEFGPYFTADYENEWYEPGENQACRFLFTSDHSGDQDIYCRYYTLGEHMDFIPSGGVEPVDGVNTEHNEAYLTINSNEIDNREVAYFSSDRDGTWDLWQAVSEEGKLINESVNPAISKVTQLSGGSDERCPYVNGRIMVFASDREGGHGGFDLWYSLFDGQGWSAPVNFGDEINSANDEFRPVVVSTPEKEFLNDLMIFSSDRPGGKGGFDLYYAGITRHDYAPD
ncbi:MAG: hypothetical protein WCE64_00210 [Bacteroidales bacterium]